MFHLAVIAATLSCADAYRLVDNVQNNYEMREELRTEIVQVVIEETYHLGCWDANAD